jgi:type II secretory pathway pseudopilin PulG
MYFGGDGKRNLDSGFTLVELLLVVSLIIILTGVLLNLLNKRGIRDKATDSVRMATLQRLSEALETHGAFEGSYPMDQSEAQSSVYVENWPDDIPYSYSTTEVSGVAVEFQLFVEKVATSSEVFFYSSKVGEVIDCIVIGASCDATDVCCGGSCSGGVCQAL